MKLSSLDYEQNCLKFALPLKTIASNGSSARSQYLEMDIYDQDTFQLPLSMLKPEYPARGLVYYKGICKDGNYFYLDWELKQLKVKIPDQVFETCQLSDNEGNDGNGGKEWMEIDEDDITPDMIL